MEKLQTYYLLTIQHGLPPPPSLGKFSKSLEIEGYPDGERRL